MYNLLSVVLANNFIIQLWYFPDYLIRAWPKISELFCQTSFNRRGVQIHQVIYFKVSCLCLSIIKFLTILVRFPVRLCQLFIVLSQTALRSFIRWRMSSFSKVPPCVTVSTWRLSSSTRAILVPARCCTKKCRSDSFILHRNHLLFGPRNFLSKSARSDQF